ncbi:MAG: type II toxin-antitoxin system RatA family toxin [Solirubrobacteraceae bacterium]
MTLLSGSSSAEIDAPVERCWAIVADVERAPGWQRGLERVEVVARDEAGRATICDTVTDAKVTKVRCRVRFMYEPSRRLEFVRVASDDVDEMRGSWELEALPGGRTRATYSLAVDPGPVGLLARPLERALRPLVVGGRAAELARAVAREQDAGTGREPNV